MSDPKSSLDQTAGDPVIDAILTELDGIRFGQVTVTVQDGHVVQIERVERRRLNPGEAANLRVAAPTGL